LSDWQDSAAGRSLGSLDKKRLNIFWGVQVSSSKSHMMTSHDWQSSTILEQAGRKMKQNSANTNHRPLAATKWQGTEQLSKQNTRTSVMSLHVYIVM
jgi:hypothetical protein